jgi:hypothetical protein
VVIAYGKLNVVEKKNIRANIAVKFSGVNIVVLLYRALFSF